MMLLTIIGFFQGADVPATSPDIGVRISVWVIVMFLLAVGGALLYLRMKEIGDERRSGDSGKT